MNHSRLAVMVAVALCAGLSSRALADDRGRMGDVKKSQSGLKTGELSSQEIISGWGEASQQAARELIDKYGEPQEITPSMLAWHGNGPWKHTIVFKDEVTHQFPRRHKDVVLQSINYQVPVDKFDDLARFDGSLVIKRTKGELAAVCDREEMNYIALNLANEIITGKRTVEEARSFMAKTAEAVLAGRSSPYAERLLFRVPVGSTGDQDKSVTTEELEQDQLEQRTQE